MAQCIERGMLDGGGVSGRETRQSDGRGVVLALLADGSFGVIIDGTLVASGSNSDMRRLYRDNLRLMSLGRRPSGPPGGLPIAAGDADAVNRAWSRLEVEATVSDYFDMLDNYLRGERFVKVEHYRALAARLQSRSQKSIEFKHANISAVLRDLGLLWIPGITPRSNYQALLAEAVFDRVAGDNQLLNEMRVAVDAPADAPHITSHLVRLVDPPKPGVLREAAKETDVLRAKARPAVNFLEREAHNASLGRAGEEFVLAFERERLASVGADRFVDRVEHVAVTRGDGLGFDVRSFDEDGRDRFIEVKTTRYGKETPFFVSKNELEVSRRAGDKYHVYRVFDFRSDPRLYWLNGPIDGACALDPIQYSARVG